MENLLISKNREGHEVFPYIKLNSDTGICSISGDSYMQNTKEFFKPVLEWFEEYISLNIRSLIVEFKLRSFNTGTSRVLYELFEILRKYKERGGDIKVKWFFDEQKEIVIDDIIDITSELGINIEVLNK